MTASGYHDENVTSTDVDMDMAGNAVVEAADGDGASPVRISDELDEKTLNNLKKQVPTILDKFKKNQSAIDEFGMASVKKLNNQVSASLKRYTDGGAADSKEVKDIFRSMTGEFENAAKDYGTFAVDKKANAMVRWFKSKMNNAKKWDYDRKSVLQKFDMAETELNGQMAKLDDNIARSEYAVKQNHEAQQELVRFVVANELVRDAAEEEVHELENRQTGLQKTDLRWNDLQQQKAVLASIIHALDAKHTEYVTSIYSAYYTAEQMNNLIQLTQSMKTKIGHILQTNIPDMKRVISQIDMMMQTRNAAEVGERVMQADRRINELSDRVMSEGTSYIAGITESPTITPEQIQGKVESMVSQNEAFIAAIEDGAKQRAEVESAAIKGISTIDSSIRKRDRKAMDAMMDDVRTAAAIGGKDDDGGPTDEGGDGMMQSIDDAVANA